MVPHAQERIVIIFYIIPSLQGPIVNFFNNASIRNYKPYSFILLSREG